MLDRVDFAMDAVRGALVIARDRGAERGVQYKVGRDVVTESDLRVEDHVRARLGASGFPVLGEERGGTVQEDRPYWMVDPICGTRNFASGLPLFAVNVALVEEGRVTVGVIGDGSSGAIFTAERGGGAWRHDGERVTAVCVSTVASTVAIDGWPPAGPARDCAASFFAGAIRSDRFDVRSFSTTLGLAYLAESRLSGYVLFDTPALHMAAGALVASEAGAVVSELGGTPWTVHSSSILACASPELHEELRDLAARTGADRS